MDFKDKSYQKIKSKDSASAISNRLSREHFGRVQSSAYCSASQRSRQWTVSYKDDRSFHRSKGFAYGKYRLGIRNIYFKTITCGVGPLTCMITLLKA